LAKQVFTEINQKHVEPYPPPTKLFLTISVILWHAIYKELFAGIQIVHKKKNKLYLNHNIKRKLVL